MKEQLIKLLQLVIICGTVIFIAVKFQPIVVNNDSEILELEKQKLEYTLLKQFYLYKVDSLENHIKTLEDKKKENLVTANKKKKTFREVKPTEKIVLFNELFYTLTRNDGQR